MFIILSGQHTAQYFIDSFFVTYYSHSVSIVLLIPHISKIYKYGYMLFLCTMLLLISHILFVSYFTYSIIFDHPYFLLLNKTRNTTELSMYNLNFIIQALLNFSFCCNDFSILLSTFWRHLKVPNKVLCSMWGLITPPSEFNLIY